MTPTTYSVAGMTCSHCADAVARELEKLDDVLDVQVELVAGGDSRVRVTSASALPVELVRDAVDEAGYRLVDAS